MNKTFEVRKLSTTGPRIVPPTAPVFKEEVGDEEINLLEYWQVIRRRARAILGIGFVALIIGALVAFSITPLFQAEVKLMVAPDVPKVVSLDPLQAMSHIKYFYKTQYSIIASRSVANAVIEELQLEKHPVFMNALGILQEGKEDSFSFKDMVLESFGGTRADKTIDKDEVRAITINYFLENLHVEGERDSQIINVSYESPDANLSAGIANAVADSYIEKGLEARLALSQKASVWLTDRLAGLRKKLENSEQKLHRFQEKEKLVDSKSHASITSDKLGGITEALIKAQAGRAEAEIRYNQVKEARGTGRDLESLQAVLQNAFVQRLKEEQVKLERGVSELSERYGERHPKMIAARADLREATTRLSQEVGKVIDGIRREYEAAVSNEKQLKRLNQQTQKESRDYKTKEFELAKLEREVESNRQLYDVFLNRFKETDLTGNNDATNITLVDSASPPLAPSKPKKKLIVAAFLAAGLFLGVILAFLLEYLENTFRTPEDVEEKLGLPVLGVLPALTVSEGTEEKPERYAFSNTQSPFVEALNAIRTGVMFANIDNPPKLIMVTSSVANEGKTTLCGNLALTFSHTGKTLLIDGDLRKQQHAKMVLQHRKNLGFAEFAAGTAGYNDCVIKDKEVDNLYHMSSGMATPKPLELLSSKRFAEMLATLREHFEHIIIDSAPLLPVSDSLILGHLVDEVILVIKADETSHAIAKESMKRLATAHVVPLGVVLQQADLQKMASYGSYYQAYGYGYGDEGKA